MTTKERSLKGLLINPPFQLKLMSYFAGLFVLTTTSLYSTTFLFFWNLKQKGLAVGIPEGHVYYQFLRDQKHDLDLLFVGLAVVNLILLLAGGLLLSHRIAGPIHRLKLYLKDPGPSEPMKLREDDFFKELAALADEVKRKERS
jgi:hypothetical protein